MPPVALGSASVTFVGDETSTKNTSFCSLVWSPLICTVIVLDVCPGANVTVPAAPTKSEPAVADPSAVAQWTVMVLDDARFSVSANVMPFVPELPSVVVASPILNDGLASSLVIVPLACPSEIVAWLGEERLTKNVSSSSSV